MLKKKIILTVAMILMAACGTEVPAEPQPECGKGYRVVVRDGRFYCDAEVRFDCPAGYVVVIDGNTYSCEPRDTYFPTADASIADAGATPDSAVETDAATEPDAYIEPSEDLDGDGYTVEDGDCDDTRSDIHPDAVEICDYQDNDCDGNVDAYFNQNDNFVRIQTVWFLDSDGDGFGNPNVSVRSCQTPGYRYIIAYDPADFDCDDTRSDVHHGANELCDGIDQDCDGIVDDGCWDTGPQDADGDGYTVEGGDCDDTRSDIHPGAEEICDGVDQDCNGLADVSTNDGIYVDTQTTYFMDSDGDGHGRADVYYVGCQPPDFPYVVGTDDMQFDCDDTRSDIHPGAIEICGDSRDNDCDGDVDENVIAIYLDFDGDGYGSNQVSTLRCPGNDLPVHFVANSDDCDDEDVSNHPGAEEICGDGMDQDCDGADLECPEDYGFYITTHPGNPAPNNVLGNTTGVGVAKFLLASTSGPWYITHFTLLNCITFSNDGRCESFGNDLAIQAVHIRYMDSSGAYVTKTGYFSNHRAVFSDISLYVGTNEPATLTVTVDTNAVAANGALSGSMFLIALSANPEEPGVEFRAVSYETGDILEAGEVVDDTCLLGSCLGSVMILRRTKPTVSLAAGSPSGAGVPGMNEVLRFNVSADSRGFVGLKALYFKIVASDENSHFSYCENLADPMMFELYDEDDPSTFLDDDADWEFFDQDGQVNCEDGKKVTYAFLTFNRDSTASWPEIPAGQTNTFVLRMDTSGASNADSDTLRVEITGLLWNDDTRAEDIGSTFINHLPVRGGTIVY